MQPPETSAVYRVLHPEQYNITRESTILEMVAVLLAQANMARGNASGAKNFPKRYEDLFAKEQKGPRASAAEIEAGIVNMQRLLELTTD